MMPGFLMATLNPGRKTRSKRKKLSAWQRLVKKAGGVMAAVKIRRSRKAGRRRRRKNPFLSTSTAAVAPLMNARRRRKNRTRRSAVSRRRLRSRSRKSLGRRPKMAKVRRSRRRRVTRGAGGRFKRNASRSHRRRRSRRNPVVPVSWNPRRKRRRSRRNPLFKSRLTGRFKGRGPGRQMHRRRRRPHYWHNPVVPVSWNPRKRRGSRRRRSYRNNPVLPFFAMNPASGAVAGILGRLKTMVDVSFWTETALPVAAGYFGSKVIGNKVYNLIPVAILQNVPSVAFPFIKSAVNAASGAVMAWGAEKFISKKVADGIWSGTVVGVAADMIKQLLDSFAPGISASLGLSGLGQSVDDRMKDAIAARVRNNLQGYLTVRNIRENVARPMNGVGSTYVTTRAGRSTYDPSPRLQMAGDIADDSTQL